MTIPPSYFEYLFELCYEANGGLPTLADLKSFLLENAAKFARHGSRRDLHKYLELRKELRGE